MRAPVDQSLKTEVALESSMIARSLAAWTALMRASMSKVPKWRSPLMKNVGVPVTPLRSAPSTSSAIRSAPASFPMPWRSGDVEAECSRVGEQIIETELTLMLEQSVVHLPEGTLLRCRLARFGRQLRVGVHVSEW